jgi:hypothetical protein
MATAHDKSVKKYQEFVSANSGLDNKDLHELPELLSTLLIDRTTKKHIIWGTSDYEDSGNGFGAEDNIKLTQITGKHEDLIQPRAQKSKEIQKARTKGKAEVFTPLWVVGKQNDLVEEDYKDKSLDDYVDRTWLEITCGEAPYMTSRYDMYTGERVSFEDRQGFIDRKLSRISKEISDKADWLAYATRAYKSSYGYEWQGDSLLIARENVLLTFVDYYVDKFDELPEYNDLLTIADIITYNVFQMDGLKFVIPMSNKTVEVSDGGMQFPGMPVIKKTKDLPGTFVKTKDWTTDKMVEFKRDIVESPAYRGILNEV